MAEKKILAILGSPHTNGMTAAMLDYAVRSAEKKGYTIIKINLYEKNISFCTGCRACVNTKTCIQKDDKMKLSRKKGISLVIIVLFLVSLISGAVYLKNVMDYKQAVKETTFDEINISDISDGVYTGEYDVDFIYAKVEVTVGNGKITGINILEHRQDRGEAGEAVINKIIGEQRIDVDTITGATNSSTVIKKAVENALTGEK